METERRLSRGEISDAVAGTGWRLVLGALRARVPASSLAASAEIAAGILADCGPAADDALTLDLRPDCVLISLRSRSAGRVTPREIELALVLADLPLVADQIQALEFAIDALDIDAVRPFWLAVTGFADDGHGALVDPLGQAPTIWFQQMDAPRPQRNRIHLDISVPHDEAAHRIEAALAAGGRIAYDAEAPAFWVLADAEGNEACVCTWQGRDVPAEG